MGYSVLLPVRYLSVVNSCPRKGKKNSWINPVPLVSFNTGAVEDVCDVVLNSWWRSQWRLDWWAWCVLVWNKIFGEFIYVPVSVKRFLFVGGSDRLPRSPYLQCKWLVMEESLLHFQIKVGVVVWFFSSFLRTVAFNRFVPLLFYVHVSTISILCLVLVEHRLSKCTCVLNCESHLWIYSSENEEKIDLTPYCTCIKQ